MNPKICRSVGPARVENIPVQPEIYRSRTGGPANLLTSAVLLTSVKLARWSNFDMGKLEQFTKIAKSDEKGRGFRNRCIELAMYDVHASIPCLFYDK